MSLYAPGISSSSTFGVAVFDSGHRAAQIVHAEQRCALWCANSAAGAVRRGVKAHRDFFADDDIAARAHRAGNHRPVAPRVALIAPLRVTQTSLAEVLLLLREVVMRVDALQLELLLVPLRRRTRRH